MKNAQQTMHNQLTDAKKLLPRHSAALFDTAFETLPTDTRRLHHRFVNIEGMTPAEYNKGAKNLTVQYSFAASPFGSLLVASTSKGVCYLAFYEDEAIAVNTLKEKFPNAAFQQKPNVLQQNALCIFQHDWSQLPKIKLHVKGTAFQLKVWEALLNIPMGKLTTYGHLAQNIGHAKASRAVGTAIGNNPVACIIPCHRVIQSSGKLGGYIWGIKRKIAIIAWESAQTSIASYQPGNI